MWNPSYVWVCQSRSYEANSRNTGVGVVFGVLLMKVVSRTRECLLRLHMMTSRATTLVHITSRGTRGLHVTLKGYGGVVSGIPLNTKTTTNGQGMQSIYDSI